MNALLLKCCCYLNPTCPPDGLGSSGRRGSRGRAHSFVGTAVYMSPERLQGEPYGPSGDVWSLGLTLLTLAIGKYPLEVRCAVVGCRNRSF